MNFYSFVHKSYLLIFIINFHCIVCLILIFLTRSIQDSETSIDFVQGPPGSRRERVKWFVVILLSFFLLYASTRRNYNDGTSYGKEYMGNS